MVDPPLPPAPVAEVRVARSIKGDRIRLAGMDLNSPWLWVGGGRTQPTQLWLPLELLVNKLGFQRSEAADGPQLEWYGRRASLRSLPQRSLDDEVAIEVAEWLSSTGVGLSRSEQTLRLTLASPRLQRLRRGKGSTANRLVFDLSGPALVQRQGNDLILRISTTPTQAGQLRGMGLRIQRQRLQLTLIGAGQSLSTLTLAEPWRIVLDGVRSGEGGGRSQGRDPLAAALVDPRIQALIRDGLVLDRRSLTVGVKPLRIYRVGSNPLQQGLRLQPLAPLHAQQGLRFLNQLSQPAGALLAVNGGFFNRVRQLPLGAVRLDGTWLSGPILNRGAIGWDSGSRLNFGRLRLHQELVVSGGQRWGLASLNSGYVQKGLSRYTRAWGPVYQALSGQEQALSIDDGRVLAIHGTAALARGVPLASGVDLIVARGGAPLPAQIGDRVELRSEASNPLGNRRQVMGGGPLLLQGGRVVLNGRAEGFSAGFMALAAPRTVVAQDRDRLWLLTLEGAGGSDPTLLETSLALRQLGLDEALNLDGGSSTSLLVANRLVMSGRSFPPRVQNALGLVPE
jgi:hypothetical protein